ncbi:MAG TPA: FecR domain-containing protein [Puia sp.]|nr:FecR domain-containing protein [Puia sp.]
MTRFFDFYKDFTPGQLADDDYFRQWVLQPDELLERFWTAYQEANPGQADTLSHARKIVETREYAGKGIQPPTTEEKATWKADIFNTLGLELPPEKQAPVKHLPLKAMMAAAVVLLIAGLYLLKGLPGLMTKKTVLLAEHTGPGEIKTLLLPDSSVVILNAGSSLSYGAGLATAPTREVWLEGNAYFNVKKDAAIRNFVIHAHSLTATVLGTQLNVDARSAATEVSLISGKVKVTVDGTTPGSGAQQQPVYLLPGYKVSLDTLEKTLTLSAAGTALYSAWTDGTWDFQHTSLAEIAKLFSEYYGTAVLFKNQKNKQLTISAVMAVGSLQKLIPVLEQTLHIKMTLSGNQLVIE